MQRMPPGWYPSCNLTPEQYEDFVFVHSIQDDGNIVLKHEWPQLSDNELEDFILDCVPSSLQCTWRWYETILRCVIKQRSLQDQVVIHAGLLVAMHMEFMIRDYWMIIPPLMESRNPVVEDSVCWFLYIRQSAVRVLENHRNLQLK